MKNILYNLLFRLMVVILLPILYIVFGIFIILSMFFVLFFVLFFSYVKYNEITNKMEVKSIFNEWLTIYVKKLLRIIYFSFFGFLFSL